MHWLIETELDKYILWTELGYRKYTINKCLNVYLKKKKFMIWVGKFGNQGSWFHVYILFQNIINIQERQVVHTELKTLPSIYFWISTYLYQFLPCSSVEVSYIQFYWAQHTNAGQCCLIESFYLIQGRGFVLESRPAEVQRPNHQIQAMIQQHEGLSLHQTIQKSKK